MQHADAAAQALTPSPERGGAALAGKKNATSCTLFEEKDLPWARQGVKHPGPGEPSIGVRDCDILMFNMLKSPPPPPPPPAVGTPFFGILRKKNIDVVDTFGIFRFSSWRARRRRGHFKIFWENLGRRDPNFSEFYKKKKRRRGRFFENQIER